MKKKIYVAFIFMFFMLVSFGLNANANSYLSDKTETVYNSSNGLLTAKANTICQTEDGYIWIGQYAGLTKYDSKSFNLIEEYQDFQTTGVTALAAVGNKLFIGTQSGLYLKDENGKITKFQTDHESISVKDIKTVNNTVFAATDKGLYRYRINIDDSIKSKSTKSCINVSPYDSENCFYVLDDFTVWGTLSESSSYYSSGDYSIKTVFFKDDILYLGTSSGTLLKREKEGNEYKVTVIAEYLGAINDIIYYDDLLFVASDQGLTTVDKNDNPSTLGNLQVNKMLQKMMVDYEGNLWVASSSDGISKITKNELVDYFYDFGSTNKDTINAIEKYNGCIYVAGTNGIYIFNEKKHENVSNSLAYNLLNVRIRDLEVYKNKLYIATYDSDDFDLVIYDAEADEIEYVGAGKLIDSDGSVKKAGQIRCFTQAGGYLYIGTNEGVSRYDGTNFLNKKLYKRPLYMYYDEIDQKIYMALEDVGINYTDIDLNDVYDLDEDLNAALKCLRVNDGLLFNNNNKLYFYKDEKITAINADFVGSITEILYLDNKYIIGTDTNIYITNDIFDENSKYTILDNSNGLKGNLNANATGYYNENDKTYYFASTEGVYLYNLDTKFSKTSRKIAVDAILADDVLLEYPNVNLDSNVNRLSIQFSVLSFVNDRHFKIYYKLEGIDPNYRVMEADETYKIEYTNIKGGDYNLSIYTLDNDGTQSFNTISINIVKAKKFYEQAWFWVLISFLTLLLIAFVNILIIHIKNVKSRQRESELKAITLESIEAIARTIDAKDSYTNGHSIRVGRYSRIIGEALGISGDELENLYYIALLHDIGKISIELNILNKPGKLTDEEFEKIKSHTTAGGKILKGISTIPHIVEGAMYHHERYDGKGYPEGLAGENIPYIARIICCADCYDAMATRRTYKEPYSKEKIISEFERCKGTQFDPHMADVVVELIKNNKLKVEVN